MIHLYTALTEALPDPGKCPAALEGLGEQRREKTLRCRLEKDRKLSLGAGLLLRDILARHGRKITEVYTGPHGKPLTDGLYFNLSHSGERVLLAVSDREIGCDIEREEEKLSFPAGHFFCRGEQEYLSGIPMGDERARAFFRLWTIKESYLKMTGEGMALPMDRFEVRFCGEDTAIYREGRRESCFLRNYTLGRYQISVCAREQITEQCPEEIPLFCRGMKN